MKIVIATNASPESFDISKEGLDLLCKKMGIIPKMSLLWDIRYEDCIMRNSPALVEVAEELGDRTVVSGSVKIVEVPDDVQWTIGIDENGNEFVYDVTRKWQ